MDDALDQPRLFVGQLDVRSVVDILVVAAPICGIRSLGAIAARVGPAELPGPEVSG